MKDAPYAWLRRMWPYLRPRPVNLIVAFFAVVAAGLVGAGQLLVQRRVLDLAVAGRVAAMRVPLALLFGLCLVGYVIARAGAYRELKAANSAQYLVYEAVHRRMLDLDVDGQQLPAGQLAARLNSDIDTLSRAVAMLPRFAGQMLATAATAVLMLRLSPVLAIPTLVAVPLLVLISRRSRRRVRPATWAAQQKEAQAAQVAAEAIAGIRVVKAFGQEEREITRMRGRTRVLYAARMRLIRWQARYQPMMTAASSLAQVTVFGLGGWLMLDHRMSLGTFLAFSSFAGQLVDTVRWFAETVVGLQEAGVSASRVLDLIDLPPAVTDSPGARPLAPVRGEFRLDGVTFAYTAGTPALDGVTLRIAPGETVAVVGASGSGKSTLVKLLARFHDPDAGTVRLDGTDIRTVTLDSLRRQLGSVFDDPVLYTGTIGDNIAFGRPGAGRDAVARAARLAGADGFVTGLDDGYDTAIGERGGTLSGGQRQRVALARALLVEPRVLLLDDATGGVDAELEAEILRRMRATGRTTVLVAYRASAAASADRVVVLDAGRVADEGSHEELLARSELYRRLVAPARPQDTVDAALARPALPRPAAAPTVPPAPSPVPATVPATAPVPATIEAFSPLRLLRPHRYAIAGVLGLFLTQAAIGIVTPYVTRFAIDDGVLAGSARGVTLAVALVTAMSVAGLLLTPPTMRRSGQVGQRVVRELRESVWTHLVRLPVSYFERQKTGRMLTRVVNDVEAFSGFAAGGVITAAVNVLTATGVAVAMLLVNRPLAVVAIMTVIPTVLLLRLLNKKIIVAYLAAREHVGEANAVLQENLAGAREAQAFRQQERQHEAYLRLVRRYLAYRLTAENLIARSFPFLTFLSSLSSAAVLAAGALMLSHGALSPGALIAFVLWSGAFYPPIVAVGQFSADVKRVQVSTARIRQLMAEIPGPPPPADPVRPDRLAGELTLTDVRFRYPGTATEVLRGFDLTVPAGSTVALIGVTGIGKSTVFKLLARFYEPTAGLVRLDGVDLRRLDPALLRGRLCYLPQEPYLFTGTIAANIAYARPHAGKAAIEAAARAVGAHDAITTLPGGYRHRVGERGADLPAGLRQLVCLARAQLTDPAIVLLDEATAKLDLATEMRVLSAVRAVAAGRTTVMIAHRIQTAMLADRIAVIDDGRVAEWGTHDELLAAGDRYAALYRASAGAAPLDVMEPAAPAR